jgi:hypothetical protein
MTESIIGLFKTEVIRCQGPWRNRDAVEMATLEWVDWYNNRPPLRGPERHPTGRGRIGLLRHHDAVREPSNGRTNPPLNSGRFNSVLEVKSRHGPRDSPTWKLVPADCRLRAAFGL